MTSCAATVSDLLPDTLDLMDQLVKPVTADIPSTDLLGLTSEQTTKSAEADDDFGDFVSVSGKTLLPYMPSQLLLDDMLVDLSGWPSTCEDIAREAPNQQPNQQQTAAVASGDVKSKSSIMELFGRGSKKSIATNPKADAATASGSKSNWIDLFAELDPLANPDLLEKKLSGQHANNQAA